MHFVAAHTCVFRRRSNDKQKASQRTYSQVGLLKIIIFVDPSMNNFMCSGVQDIFLLGCGDPVQVRPGVQAMERTGLGWHELAADRLVRLPDRRRSE